MGLFMQTILFSLFLVLTVIFPGIAALRFLGIRPSNNFCAIAIATTLGIVIYTTSLVIFRLIGLNFQAILLIYTLFCAFYLYKKRKVASKLRLKFTGEAILFVVAAVTIALLQGTQLFTSGKFIDGRLHFNTGPHDPMQHFSIISMLENGFPPKNPFYSGGDLKNYHYFSDHILASFTGSFGSNLFDLYFRSYPIFVSMFFSISAYAISKELIKSAGLRFLSLLLITMGGSASYLIPLFQQNAQRWSSISFFVDQPYSQIFNLQNYIGYSFFLAGALLILTNEKTKGVGSLMASALSLGFAFPFKVFAATIGFAALIGTCAYKLIIGKQLGFIVPAIIVTLVFFTFTAATVSSYRNGLYFLPGWGLSVMIDSQDRLNLSDWSNRIEYYKSIGNLPGLFKYYFYEVLIFTLGNLNIRVIGFIFLVILFFKSPFKQKASTVFFVSVGISSISIPMLFNLGSSPYDVFQFAHYCLMVSALFTAVALDRLWLKFPAKKWLIFVASLLVLAAAIPTTVKEIQYSIADKQNIADKAHLQAIDYIKNNSQKDDSLLLYPDDLTLSISYFPAISKRAAYLTDMGSVNITGNDPQIRKKIALDFFNTDDGQKRADFLKENSLDYVVLPLKIVNELEAAKKPLNYKKVFSNEAFFVYKVD